MTYETEGDYKYVDSKDDIPVTGQGIGRNWEDPEIHEAVEAGESKLENDLNDGDPITDVDPLHGEAAATWATYKLVLGMKSPDAATRGDSLDEGTERMGFADRLKKMYTSYINSLTGSGGDTGVTLVDFEVMDYS